MHRGKILVLAGGLVIAGVSMLPGQSVAVPIPVALTKAKALLAPSGVARDVTLAGTVTLYRNGAKPESGTVTLTVVQGGATQVQWAVPPGAITEQWTPGAQGDTLTARGAKGLVTQPAGASILMPGWAWFAPAQVLNAGAVADLGPTTHEGAASEHLRVRRQRANAPAGAIAPPDANGPLDDSSATDVYLDATTGLPSAMVFRIRPYQAPGAPRVPGIRPHLGLEEVRTSDYRAVGGRMVPFHIQAFMGSHPIFDIALTGAAFNQGVTLAPLQ